MGELHAGMTFAEAGRAYAESRNFAGGKTRARFVSKRTLKGYEEFLKPLNRFFAALPLAEIHHGHLRAYQEQRAQGRLGPSDEELFERVCGWVKVSAAEGRANPVLGDYVRRRMSRIRHEEVSAAKVNQELCYLTRVLKRAGAWTPELDDRYEPLQVEDLDIPKAITREQQKIWLDVAFSDERWQVVYHYSQVAFDSTASNVELRNLRLGDLNPYSRSLNVRAATAKNPHRIRTICLNPDAWMSIEWLEGRARDLGAEAASDFLFPFCDNRGWNARRPMSESGLKRAWNAVVAASGVKLTQHGCRHTAITRFAEAGTPVPVIMARAGHISPKMMRHYISISDAAQRVAMEAVYRGEFYPANAGYLPAKRPIKQAVEPRRQPLAEKFS